jgi:hypothetical protein
MDEEDDAAQILKGREIGRPPEAELKPGLEMYWIAWNTLRGDRFFGAMGGVGRIYFTAIAAYADAVKLPPDELESFTRLIFDMDDVYVEFVTKKQKEETEKNKTL